MVGPLSSTSAHLESERNASTNRVRSDAGTIFLHWLTFAAMAISLATGLRISADGLGAVWASRLDALLPQGEIWTWHILAGLGLAFCTASYWVYLRRAVLLSRNSSKRLRTFRPPTTKRLRYRALNVALHWFAYAAIIALTVSGLALYLGHADWFLTVHNVMAWTMLVYVLLHSLAHFLYGGIAQLLRLFRPEPLAQNAGAKLFPLGIALITGMVTVVAAATFDWASRPTITALQVDSDPVLDGRLDEVFWKEADVATIATHQGANLGGSGSSDVTMRAVTTPTHIHFSFQWQDPTRSLMRVPLIKRQDGWHTMGTAIAEADVNDYYEDKFAVMFSANDGFGGGESTFLGNDPLTSYPKSPHGRGLHFTSDGRILDLWQWKSARGGLLGHMDDMHFGPPKKPTAKEAAGKSRYAAGYSADPGKAIYEYNYIADGPNDYDSPVRIKRLPQDLSAMKFALGSVPDRPDGTNDETARWWLTREESVPWNERLDDAIPVGTIMPSVLNIHDYAGDRADLSAGARWQDGVWTLEVSRVRDTGSPYDITFHPGQRVFVWLSVFDRNQTRHTRHQRSIVLDVH